MTIHPVEEGIYYIENRKYAKYVQIDDGDAPSYSNNGGKMEEIKMKKTIICLLALLFICVQICSCSKSNDTSKEATQSTQNSTETNSIDTSVIVEYPLLSLFSIEEYNDFLESEKYSDKFVKYERISELGSFKDLIITSNTLIGDYSSYMYTLVDPSGTDMLLYVYEENGENIVSLEPIDASAINREDMRSVPGISRGKYIHNDMTYRYVNGKLLSITWVNDGIEYVLSFSHGYPPNESTAVGKLLNLNTASEAYSSVIKALNQEVAQ